MLKVDNDWALTLLDGRRRIFQEKRNEIENKVALQLFLPEVILFIAVFFFLSHLLDANIFSSSFALKIHYILVSDFRGVVLQTYDVCVCLCDMVLQFFLAQLCAIQRFFDYNSSCVWLKDAATSLTHFLIIGLQFKSVQTCVLVIDHALGFLSEEHKRRD